MSKSKPKDNILGDLFDKEAVPTVITSIIATLLPNIPLTRETILGKLGKEHLGKTRGYLSNHFGLLARSGILKFNKSTLKWYQGKNYQHYMGLILAELVKIDQKAADSVQYRLLPKKEMNSLDFITCPLDNLFGLVTHNVSKESLSKNK